MHTAALVSMATSVPPHTFLQKDVLAAAWDVFGSRFPDFERFASIFANTGIVKRHGVKPFEWYLEPRGWPERTEAFLEGAEALFVDVAEKALARAQLAAGAENCDQENDPQGGAPHRQKTATPRRQDHPF